MDGLPARGLEQRRASSAYLMGSPRWVPGLSVAAKPLDQDVPVAAPAQGWRAGRRAAIAPHRHRIRHHAASIEVPGAGLPAI